MQESVSMLNTPTQLRHSRMNQARSEEEEKKRGKHRGQEADRKRSSPKKKKHTSEELKQGLTKHSSG